MGRCMNQERHTGLRTHTINNNALKYRHRRLTRLLCNRGSLTVSPSSWPHFLSGPQPQASFLGLLTPFEWPCLPFSPIACLFSPENLAGCHPGPSLYTYVTHRPATTSLSLPRAPPDLLLPASRPAAQTPGVTPPPRRPQPSRLPCFRGEVTRADCPVLVPVSLSEVGHWHRVSPVVQGMDNRPQ